ncbi:MAG: pentapeptide repeat-containing protein [Phormidesmis sp.]
MKLRSAPHPAQTFRWKTAPLALATVLLLAVSPALSEAPLSDAAVIRQNNVRQLILLNECMGCDLAGVTLNAAHLIGADLRYANLRFATLIDSNLEGADLTGADLTGANLTDAFLTHAILANAQLDGVNFSGAWLYQVDVSGADLNNIELTGAQVLDTPISVGGEEPLEEGVPLEPMMPFEITNPAAPYEPLINPES